MSIYRTDRNQAFDADGNLLSEEVVQTDVTAEVNGGTIATAAEAALVDNRAFLAIGSPTNAQTLTQVRALTRQNQGIIRLLLGRLDATD